MFDADKNLIEKWAPVLEHEGTPAITDQYKKAVTARILENQEIALREESAARSYTTVAETTNVSGDLPDGGPVDGFDPVLISLVRRAMPNLIAYDVAGVQPMTGPTGLIFAMKANYSTPGGTEALFNEADTTFSGRDAGNANSPAISQSPDPTGLSESPAATSSAGGDMLDGALTTAEGEVLGVGTGNEFPEMAFEIEKQTVTATTRALKAEYTMELAQDLKAIHGLDAEAELANILSGEILAEINREVIRTIYRQAVVGANNGAWNAATSGGDTTGRWAAEVYKDLGVQLQFEANAIAKATRRGRGNFAIVSSDVASALSASGALDYAPALSTELAVDDTGNTFAGVLNGSIKIYVDPYATINSVTVGYRGTNPYDAGIFYCPYVPLTMVKAVGEQTFQPKIGFKTRYGMTHNPFVTGAARANTYFRIFQVTNL